MTEKKAQEFTLSLFASLAFFYIVTLVLKINAIGWEWNNVIEEELFLHSFLAGIAGGFCSLVIFILMLLKHPLAPVVSWFFAGCVALIVGFDAVNTTGNISIWVISAIMVFIHVLGAVLCQKVIAL